jgi:hypothetical protein
VSRPMDGHLPRLRHEQPGGDGAEDDRDHQPGTALTVKRPAVAQEAAEGGDEEGGGEQGENVLGPHQRCQFCNETSAWSEPFARLSARALISRDEPFNQA